MSDLPILKGFATAWWALLIRGLFALSVGATTLMLPGLSLMTVVVLFGIYVLVDGMTTLWIGQRMRAWLLVAGGVLGVATGIYILLVSFGIRLSKYSQLTALALLYLVAVWAGIRGILEIGAAMRLRKEAGNDWMLLTSGVVAVMFGITFIAVPFGIAWCILGAYGVVFGAMMIGFAIHVRRLRRFYVGQQDVIDPTGGNGGSK